MTTAVFNLDSVAHALAGASGGVIAMSLLYPLENVRCRLQVQVNAKKTAAVAPTAAATTKVVTAEADSAPRYTGAIDCIRTVIETEGVSSLYTGISSALIGVGVSSAVYFFWYATLKQLMLNHSKLKTLDPLRNIAVASVAGVLNVFVTMPIWVVNTRMTLNRGKGNSIIATIASIAATEGLPAFYKGLLPSLILVSNPAIQFVVYEQLVRLLNKNNGSSSSAGKSVKLTAAQIFVLGAIAKAVATVLTYPYQVVKSRQQAAVGGLNAKGESNSSSNSSVSMIQLIRLMHSNEGSSSFFNGLGAKMSQTVTNTALMFVIYERLVRIIIAGLHRAGRQAVVAV